MTGDVSQLASVSFMVTVSPVMMTVTLHDVIAALSDCFIVSSFTRFMELSVFLYELRHMVL